MPVFSALGDGLSKQLLVGQLLTCLSIEISVFTHVNGIPITADSTTIKLLFYDQHTYCCFLKG